jgi:hypothetical protein
MHHFVRTLELAAILTLRCDAETVFAAQRRLVTTLLHTNHATTQWNIVLLPKVHYAQIPQILQTVCSIELCTLIVLSYGVLAAVAVLLRSGLNCVTCHIMTLDLQLMEHQPVASHFAAVTVSWSCFICDSR